ncbi:carboxypeptidase-like regulatory domain-containing protein [Lewinella sp. IMCC34183]|uniref:carboxypeptidase-like regulatory domain-containing protein n=1 Tax=Lewinella sp. IMCC34183 TaxID=2248762 RepID=UPI0013008495|nr:carboxypeptidase-like regulatory domain-containing protein [Lewinella sp. IMCC34183]
MTRPFSLFPTLLLWLALLFSSLLHGQPAVSGTVRDSLTGEPVSFATVYFDGTTVGTTTDDAGAYRLPLSDMKLPAVVVATHLNYRSANRLVERGGEQDPLVLAPSAYEIAAVEVGDRNNRERNLREFREAFLGTDPGGRRATLTNQERLRFDRTYRTDTLRHADVLVERHGLPDDLRNVQWSIDGKSLTFEQASDLRVSSAGVLRVDVPDLGYRVSVDLIQFSIDYRAGSTFGLGTYYFEPYEGNGKARGRHVRNRRETYYLSSQHFLRALYADNLAAEGFAVYEMVDDEARPIDLTAFLRRVSDTEMAIEGLNGRRIAVLYYHDRRGRPLPPDRRKRAAYTTSYLTVLGPSATFRADGTLGNSPISFGGTMGAFQVTRMLPSDYRPE